MGIGTCRWAGGNYPMPFPEARTWFLFGHVPFTSWPSQYATQKRTMFEPPGLNLHEEVAAHANGDSRLASVDGVCRASSVPAQPPSQCMLQILLSHPQIAFDSPTSCLHGGSLATSWRMAASQAAYARGCNLVLSKQMLRGRT